MAIFERLPLTWYLNGLFHYRIAAQGTPSDPTASCDISMSLCLPFSLSTKLTPQILPNLTTLQFTLQFPAQN